MSNETRLHPPKCDPWEALRHAIVVQAVDDLRYALRYKVPAGYPKNTTPRALQMQIKRFLCGEWGAMLMGELDGQALYERVVREERERKGRLIGRGGRYSG
ncbi:MAG TPA: hypothetical protein PKZ40_03760 [Anaerolineaceae bacterium]|nr:hypothetical protein [Anaerolineaceae bacterium]